MDDVNTSRNTPDLYPPAWLHVLSVLVYAWLAVRLFLWGGWGLGFTLLILLTEAMIYGWLLLPRGAAKPDRFRLTRGRIGLLAVLTACIVCLAACYAIWSSLPLRVINFLVLAVLLLVQFMLLFRLSGKDWDHPLFWLESALAPLVRPLLCLGELKHVKQLVRPTGSETQGQRHPALRQAIAIAAGVLIALPLLLLLGSLLASADAVFADKIAGLTAWLQRFSFTRLARQLLTALVLAPFIFSVLESGRRQRRILSLTDGQLSGLKANPGRTAFARTILITILVFVTGLYAFFAVIQYQYLSGALRSILPEHLTYAEYARSGFFELLAVSLVNLVLIYLAARAARTQTTTAWTLRVLEWLLILGSLIQWVSAISRMRLYVDTYGLTRLRFLSTAFMGLILVWHILFVLQIFMRRLPLFKSMAIAAVFALLVLNAVNPDWQIARYNVQHEAQSDLDQAYLLELSDDAVICYLPLLQAADPKLAKEMRLHLEGRLERLNAMRWQELSWQQWRLRSELTAALAGNQGLSAG